MNTASSDSIKNVTPTDYMLARVCYSILLERVRRRDFSSMTYSGLATQAKERFPNVAAVTNMMPILVGRRLGAMRLFTNKVSLPDLSCLIVNKSEHVQGDHYRAEYDPDVVLISVVAQDWSKAPNDFNDILRFLGIEPPEEAVISGRIEAEALLDDYIKAFKKALDSQSLADREPLVQLIMEGENVSDLFSLFLAKPNFPVPQA